MDGDKDRMDRHVRNETTVIARTCLDRTNCRGIASAAGLRAEKVIDGLAIWNLG
jgi:hypothetical protein